MIHHSLEGANMIRVFPKDGKWAFEVTDQQGLAFSEEGFTTSGEAEMRCSRLCAALNAGFRDIEVEI